MSLFPTSHRGITLASGGAVTLAGMRLRSVLTLGLLLSMTAQAAPVRVEFWHAMNGVRDTVAGYARDFNKAQDQYEVVPVSFNNYRDLLPKFQAALKAGNAPALVQLEFTQFPALADSGQLLDLTRSVNALPDALQSDIYPVLWKTGQFGGKTYGLPWNVSVPVLMYNAGTLKRSGVSFPNTWTGLEAASKALATGGRRPLVAASDAWTFEANVLSRGGSLLDGNKPNLNGPDALEALTQLARMSAAGQAQPRNLDEAVRTAFDFARGQNVFVLASVANWIDARKVPFFQLGIAPFPCEKAGACTVPLGGGTLAVPKGTSAPEQAGALAFWQFMLEPSRVANWVQTTAYVPTRKAALPLLEGWYVKNPQLRAAHAQISRAVPRPSHAAYADWIPLLEDAIAKATTGKMTAKAALDEVQRKALEK